MKKITKNIGKRFCIIIFTIIMILPKDIFCSQKFSPTIKFGVNSNLITDPKNCYNDYSYPLGFSFGVSIDKKIVNKLFISNSIYFNNKKAKSHIDILSGCSPIILDYDSQYIRFSSEIGINIYNNLNLLLGYDIGRLINLKMLIKACGEDKFKPIDHSKYDNILSIGIRKDLDMKTQKFIVELKYLYGLNKYDYHSNIGRLPYNSRHHGLELKVGYKLNFK